MYIILYYKMDRLVVITLSADGHDINVNGMTKTLLRKAMKGILPKYFLRTDNIDFGTP